MSLINDMLRDIEAKRPDDPGRQNLQREIRTLPVPASGSGRWFGRLLPAALLIVAAVVLQLNGLLLPPPGSGEPRSGNVLPVVAATPAPVPASAAVPVSALAAVGDARKAGGDPSPAPPPLAAPILPVPDPVAPPAPVAAAEVPKPAAALLSGPVKIEKNALPATARDRADAEYRKAENALTAGHNADAAEGFRAALKQDPLYVQARQMLLRLLLEMQKTEEMMPVLQEGIDLQPAQAGWAMSLARLQLEHDDLAAADRTLARSQSYAEASADYAGFQGHLKSRLGAHHLAVSYYQRAVRLAPNEGRWWLGLGLALEADGKSGEAREAFRHGLATATLSADLAAVAQQHLN